MLDFFFLIEFNLCVFYFYIYFINIGWIRNFCLDPELLPGSGTRKIQSWIRIRKIAFRFRDTERNADTRASWAAMEHGSAPVTLCLFLLQAELAPLPGPEPDFGPGGEDWPERGPGQATRIQRNIRL